MERYCPVCDGPVAEMQCPIHDVPTVSQSAFTAQPVSIAVGDLVDDTYRVTAVLGSGSMGTVYAVENQQGERLALKIIKIRDDSNRQIIRRFYREALAVSKLKHPGIVEIERFAVDERTGLPYQTMEFIEGQTLYDFLALAGQSIETILNVTEQVLEALSHAHQLGIVHRDLKPENIMLVKGEGHLIKVKVLDFGIAKILEHEGDAPTLTATGVAVGTPYYMSPEQAKGSTVTPAADLYSVACLLFEMLYDRPPFEAGDFIGILISHVRDPIPEPPEAAANGASVPSHVRALIKRALAKDPSHRHPSAAAMKSALLGASGLGGAQTMEVHGVGYLLESDTDETKANAELSRRADASLPKSVLSQPVLWMAIGGVVLLAILGGLFL